MRLCVEKRQLRVLLCSLVVAFITRLPPDPFSSRARTHTYTHTHRYEPPLPVYLSPAARDLVKKLLTRQPRWRLGCGGGGAEEVRQHAFFKVRLEVVGWRLWRWLGGGWRRWRGWYGDWVGGGGGGAVGWWGAGPRGAGAWLAHVLRKHPNTSYGSHLRLLGLRT